MFKKILQKTWICIVLILFIHATSFALYTDGVRMPHKITTYNPDRGSVIVAGLDFSTSLTVNIDGVLVAVETPGAEELDRFIRVTAYIDDLNEEIKYEYNTQTRVINMIGSFGTRTYSPNSSNDNEKDVYYNILYVMYELIEKVYEQMGVCYDPSTKNLEIDKKYIDSIDSNYTIASSTDGDIATITIAKGGESLTCNYDLASNTFSISEEIQFANNYNGDLISGTLIVTVDKPVAATAVSAMMVTEDFKESAAKFLSFIVSMLMVKGDLYHQLGVWVSVAQKDKTPMLRPAEPTIDDIVWLDKDSGIIEITGSADMWNYPPRVLINGSDYNVSGVGNTWTFTNYGVPLGEGENKINAVVKIGDQVVLESGDATVYLGSDNEPDLILVSPRDRGIFESSIFPFRKTDLKIKGKTMPGVTISVLGNILSLDSFGYFNEPIEVPGIQEGINEVFISVSGSEDYSLNKIIIGAYKFAPNNKSQAYILRKGDFLFNEKAKLGLDVDNPFDYIPYDPNHAGIYTGNGKITEAVWNKVVENSASDWNNTGFTGASQVPLLVDEETRIQIADLIIQEARKNPPPTYDWPIGYKFRNPEADDFDPVKFEFIGHYNGSSDGFYCSELAYWGWEQIMGKNNFGIRKGEIMYPFEGVEDDNNNSILPAYLYAKSLELRKVSK